MKKFIISILVFVLMCSTCCASELSNMTTDELLLLRTEINDELSKRFSSNTYTAYAGLYTCGVDIAPGSYHFTFLGAEDVEAPYCEITVYNSMEAYKSWDCYIAQRVNLGTGMHVSLTEGEVVFLDVGVGEFVPEAPGYAK